jgi:DNA-binding IclR family transcriptional regulator
MTSGGKNMFYGGMLGIARRTGLSKETVRVAMNWLVREGWLVREDHEWRNGERRLFTVLTHDQFVEKHGGDSCRQS